MPNSDDMDPKKHLARFGLSEFRSGQEEVISAVLDGRDCLCVMPTGGGKSLCYQLPAVILDGLTLVVSPLIALMKDQVDQLQVLGLPVSFINSTLPMAEQYARLERMAAGEYRLVYVVPERFRSQRFLEAVRRVRLRLLAIDEAHCISEWGHDFRPDYARLGYFRRMLGGPVTIALTATATDRVRRDIVEQLDLRDPQTFITGFARPNLFYEVHCPRSERRKGDILLQFLADTPGSGIIYASTRKRTEEVAEMIAQNTKRSTVAYHAGLLPDQRRAAQDAFMKGRCEIVVATNAFGMGIDKADVRYVVHYNLPGTLEAYYQEAGRAGRDAQPSRCLLLYHASDRIIQKYFIDSAFPARENVEMVYEFLRGLEEDPIEMTQAEVKEQLGLPIGPDGVGNCEKLLESAGVLERLIASENLAALRIDSDLPTLVELLPKQAKVRRRVLQAVERLVGTRRNELIHFHPRQLPFDGDLDQSSLANALRELNRLESFTYVPPFRGRAIRMIRRDLEFDELEIDFDALERRKQAEFEKLNRVISFALGEGCRQREILRYFGEREAPRCGHCDNCRRGAPDRDQALPVAHDPKLIEAVRMVLSGVARTQTRFPCGKILIAQMLCGSSNARMAKLRLDTLSTFGLLGHLTQPEVVSLIEGLIAIRCLRQVDIEPMRPVIELTDSGADVMRQKAVLEAAPPIPPNLLRKLCGNAQPAPIPAEQPPQPQPEPQHVLQSEPEDLPPPDAELLAALSEWRRQRAAEAGVPPFHVMWNKTLQELARRHPDSPEALLQVKGIGPATVERYAKELLAILAGHRSPPHDSRQNQDVGTDDLSEREQQPGDGTTQTAHATQPPQGSEPPSNGAMPPPPIDSEGESPREETPQIAPERADPAAVQPSHYWTWRLLCAGFSADECSAIRGVQRDVILDHSLRAVDSGWEVRPQWCLSDDLLAAIEGVIGREDPAQIRPLLSRLPDGTRYEEVLLFLKCRRQGPHD